MPKPILTNNAVTQLLSSISASATTLIVSDGSQFPTPIDGDYAYVTLQADTTVEIVKMTARSGNTLTVTRAQDGTTASAFDSGTAVSLRVVKAIFEEIHNRLDATEKTTPLDTYSALTAILPGDRTDGELRYIMSRALANDGGAGFWEFDSGSTATPNGGTILQPDVGSGRLIRRGVDNEVEFSWFPQTSAGLQAAVNYARLTSRTVIKLPAGVTELTGDAIAVAMTGQSGIVFVGAGIGITQLLINNTSGDGFAVTCPEGNWWLNVSPSCAIGFRDMSIVTNKQNLGTGIFVDGGSLEGRPGAPMFIQNVEIRGNDQFEDCFAKGVDLLDVPNLHASNVHIYIGGPNNRVGVGWDIRATDATTDPTILKFDHCVCTYGNIGWRIGDYVEGVYLTQCDGINQNQCLRWAAAAESGLHVVGGHYIAYEYCFYLDGVHDGGIANALIWRLPGEASFRHIRYVNGGGFTFTGNQFRGLFADDEASIEIDAVPEFDGSLGVMVSGNQFGNVITAISLGTTARNVNVGPNNYSRVTNKVAGTPTSARIYNHTWTVSSVKTLTGGAASEVVDFAIPAGHFEAKPSMASCVVSGDNLLIGFYDYDGTSSTSTNVRFVVRRIDGGTISGNLYRFNVLASE